jgi:ADP-ribose pyrophosphatase YjhB (NUDIX family)
MPISDYLRKLRAKVGNARLVLPSVAAIIYDDAGRILLVRQAEGSVWSTPGGTIEPDEVPADAVVREAWEETGLEVEPVRVLGIYGGPEFIVHYPNGDEAQYVIIAFECAVRGGAARPDGSETLEVRYWSAEEARRLTFSPWLPHVLPNFFERRPKTDFRAPRWRPPRLPP